MKRYKGLCKKYFRIASDRELIKDKFYEYIIVDNLIYILENNAVIYVFINKNQFNEHFYDNQEIRKIKLMKLK